MGYLVKQVLSEDHAEEICSWRYEGEYAIYNFSDWNIVLENGWDLAVKEKREAEFLEILHNEQLIAYGRIFTQEGKVFIGVGLKPSLCGKGQGREVMELLMEECKNRHPEKPVALEVRSFNIRAINCYEKIGFKIKDKYMKDTFTGKAEFYYMER